MTAYWCQQGANYCVVEADYPAAALGQAEYALIGRRVSWLYRREVWRARRTRGPVTVRPATPDDLAVWADHLASLEQPAPPTEEPML
jgi:hypothetical protein